MKKFVFISLNKNIVKEMEAAALMELDIAYELHCFDDVIDVETKAAALNPDLIILSYDALKSKDEWNFGSIPVVYHARKQKDLSDGARYGYKTVGVAATPSEILKILDKHPYEVKVDNEDTKPTESKKEKPETKQKTPKKEKEDGLDVLDENSEDEPVKEPTKEKEPIREPINEPKKTRQNPVSNSYMREKEEITTPKPERKLADTRQNIVKDGFLRDTGKSKKETKVVTVYSAKGGVGKTTIAVELASYLSLVSVGKRKLRVCIVDYNIDFGDVRSTIHMENDKLNLTHWAAEVQDYLEMGKLPEDIFYSRDEIENWLTKDKKTGLYVLPAPLTNEDSMGIESQSLSIILDNIISNGGFDYVICDTGNNTRDSTMIALERASMILLIMTQNVNTANCDKAFIDTMKAIDFDLSHAKLVINCIMPQKVTGISVQEIVEFFPFECIGKLKFNTDVVKAGNLGEPLAANPGHDFTRQMRSIVSYVLQSGEFEEKTTVKRKKSLFDIFRK